MDIEEKRARGREYQRQYRERVRDDLQWDAERKAADAQRAREKRARIAAERAPKPVLSEEERKTRARDRTQRYRERLRAQGLPASRPRTEEQKAQNREAMRQRRAEAHSSGEVLPSEMWWKRNPERHRLNGQKWRQENPEYARAIGRKIQERRRSTPWGQINNRIWPILHHAVRINSHRESQYTRALGYTWAQLRQWLEFQFQPGMSWDNWGEVWELDHIRPVSEFRYISLDDPLFREAWRLGNLRPLWREENQAKGNRL